jgi:large conductance mechanosensitive channel
MISEFKDFINKGNVMDLAVGVIIGSAFGAIVTALVEKIINPIIGIATGGVKFDEWGITLKEKVSEDQPALILGLGGFIAAIMNFLIIAFVVFMLVKAVNRARAAMEKPKPAEEAAPAGPTQEELLAEIRDLLKARG